MFSALLRFGIFRAEGLYSYLLHDLGLHGTVGVVRACLGDSVYNIHPFDDLAECGIGAVQVRSSLVHDEELGAGGVGSHCPCHGQYTFGVSQAVGEAVLGELALDPVAGAAHACAVRSAALDHKAADDAVEDESVIKMIPD